MRRDTKLHGAEATGSTHSTLVCHGASRQRMEGCIRSHDTSSAYISATFVATRDLQGHTRSTGGKLELRHCCHCLSVVDRLYNSFNLPSHMYCGEHLCKGPRHDTYHENGRFETMVHRSSLQLSQSCFQGCHASTLRPVPGSE